MDIDESCVSTMFTPFGVFVAAVFHRGSRTCIHCIHVISNGLARALACDAERRDALLVPLDFGLFKQEVDLLVDDLDILLERFELRHEVVRNVLAQFLNRAVERDELITRARVARRARAQLTVASCPTPRRRQESATGCTMRNSW